MSYRGSRQDKARNNDYNTYNRNEVNSSYITNPQTDEEYRAAIAQQQLAYGAEPEQSPPNDDWRRPSPVPRPISRPITIGSSVRSTKSVSSAPTIYAAPIKTPTTTTEATIGPTLGPAPPPKRSTPIDNSSSKAPMTSAVSANPHGSNLTVRRAGGGQKWEDPTLLDWNPNDFRLFVGNLSGEVTETHLTNAFGKYPSLSKVRVVRDSKSKTQKTKGYGFVAFSDPEDYFRAFKDMNGKYVGGHPVHLKRATTDVKPSKVKRSSPYQRK